MSKLVLGLDIGVSSVGWGIINEETGEIVDAGVRLFEEADRNANEDRRNFRSARRLKRRRKHRMDRTKDFLEENGLSCTRITSVNPYEARYLGLRQQITHNQLAAALYHLVKRRGTTIDAPEEEEKTSGSELSTKKQLQNNKKLLEEQYEHIVEIQYAKLQNNEPVRTHENRFRTSDYIKEATAILEKQREYYEFIDEIFIEDYIALLNSRRMYYDGPGSEKSPTPYGQYFLDNEGKLQHETMIDKMRGRDIYLNELRIPKKAYTAELFNILNDLNNLRYPSEEKGVMASLTQEEKEYLIETYLRKGKKITLKNIAKLLELSNELEIKGARLDMKNNNPIFTEFLGFKQLNKYLKEVSLPKGFLENRDVLDEVVNILTAEKSFKRREDQLNTLFVKHFDDPLIDVIKALENDTYFKEYHSLSKEVIEAILPELWETDKNQMQIFTERGFAKDRMTMLQTGQQIQFDDEAILSTVAKRAHREAIKITNAVRKQHGELAYVVIEMAREKNNEERRKQYRDFQTKIGKFEKEMAKLLEIDELKELYLNSKQMLALKLWDAQDHKCVYSGRSISVHDIVKDFSQFEIDHIIPLSISYDDSQQNKVLCYRKENQLKGQLTPFQYFQSGKASRTFNEFAAETTNLFKSKKISKIKFNYLLEQRDVKNDEELQVDFINRNLVDTRYAMRSFQASLRTFYINSEIDTKVLSVRGSFTAALRRRAKLRKSRDEDHSHHAIDALIVAGIGRLPLIKQFKNMTMTDEGVVVDTDTGEILSEREVMEPAHAFLTTLKNYKVEKYSHKVDRKPNRTMSNQTFYSTREKEGEKYVVGKVKDIYALDKKGFDALKKRIDKNPDLFLMAQHDPKTWTLILKVIEEHAHADNPFQDFQAQHGFILKDGKIPVKGLKYLDRKLGIHIPITHKFPEAKNDVILQSRKSIRIDVYKNDEGKYKYLGVPYNWFRQQGDQYILDMDKYNGDEGRNAPYKQIDHSFEFQFSLYKNDRISYEKEEKIEDPQTSETKVRVVRFEKIFRGDAMPRGNKIEVKDVDYHDPKQQFLTIGTLKNFKKFNIDALGNQHFISKENLVNILKNV
ncbi:type II CRISPR RNA-guided endonuclease Cas9 [Marinilactibacillus sp. Marseille-P9653]|uniref:type II CRISPR RNA-guided endonuclease Cas9 n=1 Tax=Marinilactibacillus sp. Marseille-P9653 TaxID=2866583 RepID=UPI001CE4171E|nr:type II CRISPR RNA-guided endonuclease Cas9 [Marinilactibacillus sp. Marseille-P9653]